MTPKGTLRTCEKGHRYYKSSNCPACPVCEATNKPDNSWLSVFSAPARRALANNGIKTINDLCGFSEKEVLQFHGMGPSSFPKLKQALKDAGLTFKK